MSLGVNLLVSLWAKSPRPLGDDYDVEIIEAHHRFKKTRQADRALALGRSGLRGLNRDLTNGVNGRKGIVGERTKQEIAMLSVRAGDISAMIIQSSSAASASVRIHPPRSQPRDLRPRRPARAQWLVKQKPDFTVCRTLELDRT
jgi:4-hydroxy-tetrahydrodipicolinate reductase